MSRNGVFWRLYFLLHSRSSLHLHLGSAKDLAQVQFNEGHRQPLTQGRKREISDIAHTTSTFHNVIFWWKIVTVCLHLREKSTLPVWAAPSIGASGF